MMESQKKAAEAAESMLAAVAAASAPTSSSSSSAEVEIVPIPITEVITPHASATATVHDDFGDDSSDDSESGIAFLSATVGGTGKKARVAAKDKTKQKGSTAAAAAAVMSLQRMHWTKEMVSGCLIVLCMFVWSIQYLDDIAWY